MTVVACCSLRSVLNKKNSKIPEIFNWKTFRKNNLIFEIEMNEKHRMLYPPIEANENDPSSSSHRREAAAAMGLPIEPPPTYEAAVASPGPSNIDDKWVSSNPISTTPVVMHQPHPIFLQSNFSPALPSINEQSSDQPQFYPSQPQPQPQLPQQHHHHHQQQQQQQQQQYHQPQILQQTAAPTITSDTPNLGPDPCKVTCPACGARKTTRMSYTPNSKTHLCALVLCLVGWCCCACCVPYCMKSCRTGNHYCSKCNTFLGTYTPQQNKT